MKLILFTTFFLLVALITISSAAPETTKSRGSPQTSKTHTTKTKPTKEHVTKAAKRPAHNSTRNAGTSKAAASTTKSAPVVKSVRDTLKNSKSVKSSGKDESKSSDPPKQKPMFY